MTQTGQPPIESVAREVRESLASILGDASPDTIFSEPIVAGDQQIITASAWERGGGFGFGGGTGDGPEGGGTGAGAGGGGGSQGRPVAVITIGPQGVRVEPILDFTKILVTVLLAALGVWRALRR
ncbi:MAG TPA: spore germination protein GerW family protein [Acidimicrobiia bacterium]|nr:spore germination protein GerW family protein [Acidimicrobiia bacterium]